MRVETNALDGSYLDPVFLDIKESIRNCSPEDYTDYTSILNKAN